MAAKKIKTEQEAKAPETPAAEPQAGQEPGVGQTGNNLESGEGTGQESDAEGGKDTDPDPDAEDGGDAGEDMETGEDAKEKPLPKVLMALRPILYLARHYKAGDSLPVNNPEMIEAWIDAGSAEWREKKGRQFFP